jgi:protein-lysine N-methyltransferase EEF2KMT
MTCTVGLFAPAQTSTPALLINKTVLELGSGTGFLGLIVADIQVNGSGTTGRDALYLTDVNGDVLRRCHENTRLSCSEHVSHDARRTA